MGAVFRRELLSFFTSPIAYVFLAVFDIFAGIFFYMSSIVAQTSDMSGSFASIFLLIIFLIPILTMRLFSEEKKQKTEQGLLTAPVSLSSIVMGKYFAALVLFAMAIVVFLLFALVLEFFGTILWFTVISNVVALFLLGGAFISIGLFISSLTENQIAAAVGSFIALMVFYLIDSLATLVPIDFIKQILIDSSFFLKYFEFTTGIFNLSSIIFFVSVSLLFNFLTIRILEKRRWS